MIAVCKSVDMRYGECYGMMLMDESVFEKLFAARQDAKSTWHLFTSDQTEIYHTGRDACLHPDRLISESNSGRHPGDLYRQDGCRERGTRVPGDL